jgi:hypothetical protein
VAERREFSAAAQSIRSTDPVRYVNRRELAATN